MPRPRVAGATIERPSREGPDPGFIGGLRELAQRRLSIVVGLSEMAPRRLQISARMMFPRRQPLSAGGVREMGG